MILLSLWILWIAASLAFGALWALTGTFLSRADSGAAGSAVPVPVRARPEPARPPAERIA